VVEWLGRMITALKGVPKIEKLRLPILQVAIQEAKAALDECVKGIPDWYFPVDFESRRQPYMQLVRNLQTALSQVKRHIVGVTRTHAEQSKGSTAKKTHWRTERNKIRAHCEGTSVPTCISKQIADVWWGSVADPRELDMQLEVVSPTCPIGANSTLAAWAAPWSVTYDSERIEDDASKIQISFSKFYLEHRQVCAQLLKDCEGVMRAPQTALTSAIGLFNPAPKLDLSFLPAVDELGFAATNALPVALWAGKCDCLSVAPQHWPFARMPCYLQVMCGRAVVVVMTAETLEPVGDLTKFLVDAEMAALAKHPTFLANEGDVVWIPAACQCLVYGVPPHIKVEKATGVDLKCKVTPWSAVGIAIHPAFATSLIPQIESSKAAMLSSYAKTSAWIPTAWKTSMAVKRFREGFKPAGEEPAEIAEFKPVRDGNPGV
jgi:hypothetical protein